MLISKNAVLSLACLLLLACANTNHKTSNEPMPGLELELAKQRARQISNIKYSLSFSIPKSKDMPLAAEVDISFDISSNDKSVILDFKDEKANILDLTLNGEAHRYVIRNQHLILKNGLVSGSNRLKLKYHTSAPSISRSDDYVYSLFVPDRASQVFPSFDQPDLKAKFTLKLDVPSKWIAVSNEKLLSKNTNGDRVSYSFAQTPPISTYLFAFTAGQFRHASIDGKRPMTMYYRESDDAKVKRNLKKIFSLHTESLEKLEAYTGMPYPFSKLDIVLIPSFQFGGMEHPGSIFYNEQSLFLDQSANTGQVIGRASLIAHETAHMWFGDLVTMHWFDDVWLKEVMANFLAAKVIEPMFPKFNHQLKFYLRHYPKAYDIDRADGANSIRQKLGNLNNAGSIYGPIIYLKAPIVMRQLETIMGPKKFRQGIRDYLQKYQFGNASWPDLLAALQAHTKTPLALWSQSWLEQPGRPEIVVEYKPSSILVKQRDTSGANRIWPQKFSVLLGKRAGPNQILSVDLQSQEQKFNKKYQPDFILGNSRGKGYGHFKLCKPSQKYLIEDLNRLSDPLSRSVAWTAIWDEYYEGRIDSMKVADLALRSLTLEKNELILEYLLERFQLFYWSFLQPAQRAEILPKWESSLWVLLMSKQNKKLKSTYWRTLVSLARSDEIFEKFESVLNKKIQIPGLPLVENDEIELAYELALKRPEKSLAILDEQYSRIQNPDRKAEFLFVRQALANDELDREKFFYSLKDPNQRKNERWVEKALYYLTHPLRPNTEYMIRPGLEWVEDIQKTNNIFFPQTWIKGILNGRQSETSAQIVKKFLANHPRYPNDLRNKILQSADMLFRSSSLEQKKNLY